MRNFNPNAGLRHGRLPAIMAGVAEWPFNPNFPQAFSFPAFGTAEWLALAWWKNCKGDANKVPSADKIKAGAKMNWRGVWRSIGVLNQAEPMTWPGWWPDTTHYSMISPEGWVKTLLDAERFWLSEINGWALGMVEKEYRETNHDGVHLYTFADFPNGEDQCEWFCRRFHAYQQARYRWHEHLLEKHCERALGKHAPGTPTGYIPQAPAEARASLIGWLSKQRGFAKHPLARTSFKGKERTAFDSERANPSSRRYRRTHFAPSRPDEMGWLILTWPVWNFYRWRWTDIAEAVIEKFRIVDAKGKPLDLLKTSRKRFKNALRQNLGANNSMPAENALALIDKFLCHPTRKEKERHEDCERRVRSRKGQKDTERLARLAVGTLKISERPRGRGRDEKPPFWDFAQQFSA